MWIPFPSRRRILYWLPAVLLALLIFILSSIPYFGPLEVPVLKDSDKLIHGFIYGLLAVLVLWGWQAGFRSFPALSAFFGSAAGSILYGAFDEWHQSFVRNRTPSSLDWYADSAGAIVGIVLVWLYLRHRRSRWESRR